MPSIILGSAALNQKPKDWEGNYENILACIQAARNHKVDILCLPSLAISGDVNTPQLEDTEHRELAMTASSIYEKIVSNLAGMCVCLGLPIIEANVLREACVLWYEGLEMPYWRYYTEILGDEARRESYIPFLRDRVLSFPIRGNHITVGCHLDALSRDSILPPTDIILNPCRRCFPEQWRRIRSVAEEMNYTYLYSGPLGQKDKGAFITHNGSTIAEGCELPLDKIQMITAEIEIPYHSEKQNVYSHN